MRKSKIALYIALLAIIIGGAPYFTGYLVETKFQDVVRVLSDMDSTSVVIVKYDRGWRKSFAQTRVTFSGVYSDAFVDSLSSLDPQQKNDLKAGGFSILLNHDIRHGPFVQVKDGDWSDWRFALATFHSQVFLTDAAKETLKQLIGHSTLIDINGEMTIEGAVNIAFKGAPLKWQAAGTEALNWKGMHGKWHLSRNMKHFKAEMMFPGITFESSNGNFSFDDVVIRNDQHRSQEGLWLGEVSGQIQTMAVTDKADPTQNASFTSMTLGSQSDSKAGLVDGSGTITISQVSIAGKQFGPFTLVMSMKNIQAVFVKAVIEASKSLQDPANQPVVAQKLMMMIPELLKHRPMFSIDNISLTTTEGELKANLNFAVGGPEITDINNVQQIVSSISAKANAVFPKLILQDILTQQYTQKANTANQLAAQSNQKQLTDEEITQQVAQQVQQSISQAVTEGYLIEKDNLYTAEWEFSQNQFKVNGKPMALPTTTPGAAPAVPSVPPVPSAF